jgi:rod shape-determining protein MreD
MTGYSERILDAPGAIRRPLGLRIAGIVLAPFLALLFQVYVTRFVSFLSYLELPLLMVVYFALVRREPVSAVFYGASVGLFQDALSAPGSHPIGMYGIVKTLVGYFAASVSQKFDVENPVLIAILTFFFYFFHEFFYWVLTRALLGEMTNFETQQKIVFGLLNAAVSLPLFHVLDKMKVTA